MEPNKKLPAHFRRQFLLAPATHEKIADWQSNPIRRYGVIQHQADLEFTQRSNSELQLTLLGFAFDPRKPTLTNDQILEEILMEARSARDVLKLSALLGGRWVMIAVDQNKGLLFNDPMGLREVNYLHGGAPWCSSQWSHIAQALDLKVDSTINDDFVCSKYAKDHAEYFWPGDLTPYLGLKHLTPNHSLDLGTMQASRFWPSEKLTGKALGECIDQAAPILAGLVAAAHQRFPLALPLTAGFDSRTILAATRPFATDLFYYTLKPHDMKSDHRDLTVPSLLLNNHGLTHHQIACPAQTSPEMYSVYCESVSPAFEVGSRLAEALYLQCPVESVSLSGHGGEIFRCFYYPGKEHPEKIDGRWLANAVGMAGIRSAEIAFNAWLEDSVASANLHGVSLLDLFYWENRVGRWAANCQSQWDLVHERFTPFNCRFLLELLLGTETIHRQAPTYRVNRELIGALWPELLSVPFNPVSGSEIGRNQKWICGLITKTLLKIRIYAFAKKMALRLGFLA